MSDPAPPKHSLSELQELPWHQEFQQRLLEFAGNAADIGNAPQDWRVDLETVTPIDETSSSFSIVVSNEEYALRYFFRAEAGNNVDFYVMPRSDEFLLGASGADSYALDEGEESSLVDLAQDIFANFDRETSDENLSPINRRLATQRPKPC